MAVRLMTRIGRDLYHKSLSRQLSAVSPTELSAVSFQLSAQCFDKKLIAER
jgi:hypothetical protein